MSVEKNAILKLKKTTRKYKKNNWIIYTQDARV